MYIRYNHVLERFIEVKIVRLGVLSNPANAIAVEPEAGNIIFGDFPVDELPAGVTRAEPVHIFEIHGFRLTDKARDKWHDTMHLQGIALLLRVDEFDKEAYWLIELIKWSGE